jgi:hypothetical protein
MPVVIQVNLRTMRQEFKLSSPRVISRDPSFPECHSNIQTMMGHSKSLYGDIVISLPMELRIFVATLEFQVESLRGLSRSCQACWRPYSDFHCTAGMKNGALVVLPVSISGWPSREITLTYSRLVPVLQLEDKRAWGDSGDSRLSPESPPPESPASNRGLPGMSFNLKDYSDGHIHHPYYIASESGKLLRSFSLCLLAIIVS